MWLVLFISLVDQHNGEEKKTGKKVKLNILVTEVGNMLVIPTQVPRRAHGRAVVRPDTQVVPALLAELASAAGLGRLDSYAVAGLQRRHFAAHLQKQVVDNVTQQFRSSGLRPGSSPLIGSPSLTLKLKLSADLSGFLHQSLLVLDDIGAHVYIV